MELKLRKCYFLQKFNEKKIITFRPVAFRFRDSFCRTKMGFDRLKILSQCGRCILNILLLQNYEKSPIHDQDAERKTF